MMKTWEEGEGKAVNSPLKPSKPKREREERSANMGEEKKMRVCSNV